MQTLQWEHVGPAREAAVIVPGVSIGNYAYVMVYDPATGKAENLGMPMPLDAKRIAAGKKEGEGVIDVTADEARGLIYVITCEEQHWMLYDGNTKKYRELGPILRDQPNTLIDGRLGHVIGHRVRHGGVGVR